MLTKVMNFKHTNRHNIFSVDMSKGRQQTERLAGDGQNTEFKIYLKIAL